MIGKTISHYRILEKLGEGGMGVVYKAQDTKLDRTVALKFLPPDLTNDDDVLDRFRREAKAAAALNHPNIITIYEIAESEGHTYIAMEYVKGRSLEEVMRDRRAIGQQGLPILEAVGIAAQISEGLEKAHRAGIVHRDIKPGNILVDQDGRVKILDFGLAKLRGVSKLTKEASTLGTVQYMSPEQTRGEEVDHRTDMWSFGCVMYEMVTGKLPFTGDYEQAVVYSILNEDPKPVTSLRSDAPSGFDQVTARALAKSPDDRYDSFNGVLEDLSSLTGISGLDQVAPASKSRKGSRRRRFFLYPGIPVLLLVLIALTDRFGLFSGLSPPAKTIDSIAVLPLENLSGDSEQEYFVDGMTEALITELSRIKALRVISRTSVMRYKGTDKSVPEIGRDLRVDAVVEGSVVHADGRIRITAQLIEAESDYHLWAESYDRDLRNILSLQKEVARTIAREIRIALTPEEERRLASAETVDSEAYKLYLKGRHHWNKRAEEEIRQSIEYFRQAIDRDPTYALAYAGLADSYGILAFNGHVPPAEAIPQSRAAVLKALEIDSMLAEAHASHAGILFQFDWDFPAAEAEFRRGLELNPSYATGHQWYGLFLASMGRYAEGIAELELAQELDPLSLVIPVALSMVLYYGGEYDRSLEACYKSLELDPDFFYARGQMSLLCEAQGNFDLAVSEFKQYLRASYGASAEELDALERGFTEGGMEAVNRWYVSYLLDLSRRRYVNPLEIASEFARIGEVDEAFMWLEKAYQERDVFIVDLNMDPVWADFHSDPRFQRIVEGIGLPQR
ncbi:MAG: protein kinase [Candidatus Eisenbacteria sp.]|nr:protein kinase [Candidatus Eisenbacteria bacterium]